MNRFDSGTIGESKLFYAGKLVSGDIYVDNSYVGGEERGGSATIGCSERLYGGECIGGAVRIGGGYVGGGGRSKRLKVERKESVYVLDGCFKINWHVGSDMCYRKIAVGERRSFIFANFVIFFVIVCFVDGDDDMCHDIA